MEGYRILENGDQAMTIELGACIDPEINGRITAMCRELSSAQIEGITDLIPTFRSLTVCYRPEIIKERKVKGLLKKAYGKCEKQAKGSERVFCIPVCYDDRFGVDLQDVADYHHLTKEEVIRLHSERDYLIFMMGFLPGFPYLGGMNEKLVTPRLSSPRVTIEPGSVGIGGEQTGIYPVASPGGWRLIGRTPVLLYDARGEGGVPYEAGDFIRFIPISVSEYEKIERQVADGSYALQIEERR